MENAAERCRNCSWIQGGPYSSWVVWGEKVVLRTWVPGRTIEARVTFRDLLDGSKINLELLRWREKLKAVKESFHEEAEQMESQRLWRKQILLASAV